MLHVSVITLCVACGFHMREQGPTESPHPSVHTTDAIIYHGIS